MDESHAMDREGKPVAAASPFAQAEGAAGATWGVRFGMRLPEDYGDPAGEYGAVRSGVGLVDLSFRGLLQVTGSERLRWLNGQVTNDVARLQAGEGKPAAVLTAKGHILSDLAVYGLADSIWVDLPRQREETVRAAFNRHIIADDVTVEAAGARLAHLMLAGPAAAGLMAQAAGEAVADLPAWHHREVRLGDVPGRVAASRWLQLPTYDVWIPVDAAGTVWEALRRLDIDARPVGMAALDVLRLEAGWPWYGVDFDEGHLLMEALTPAHVSFTKGCYVGQEVVIRVEHQGHVNRRLCGLVVVGATAPPSGADILADDKKVGSVTSAGPSPALGRVIALGFIRRECSEAGTRLRIRAGEEALEAEVVALPFVPAPAWRPES